MPHLPALIELRQYTLHPGQRETLIELFEREFITPQQDAGMTLLGQFRDLDDADRFVWLRGFASMPQRAQALGDFYGGPVWQRHRDAANATMIDSDNVLLLKPARPGAITPRTGLHVATTWPLAAAADAELLAFIDKTVMPLWRDAGADWLATLVTESHPNTFPRLPVREGENVIVSWARFDDGTAHARFQATLAQSTAWLKQAFPQLQRWLASPPEVLRLVPTAFSSR